MNQINTGPREDAFAIGVSQTAVAAVSHAQRTDVALVRHIAPTRGEHRCPACRSIIYSRRHRLCGVCSRPLPEALLFTVVEARRIEGIIQSDKQQHKQWLANNSGGGPAVFR